MRPAFDGVIGVDDVVCPVIPITNSMEGGYVFLTEVQGLGIRLAASHHPQRQIRTFQRELSAHRREISRVVVFGPFTHYMTLRVYWQKRIQQSRVAQRCGYFVDCNVEDLTPHLEWILEHGVWSLNSRLATQMNRLAVAGAIG